MADVGKCLFALLRNFVLLQRWTDFQMTWDPKDYDGINEIRVAPEKIWLPDIVLFNK